ncbi:MAG: RapZ C-terminal domain-containing protein, partial [Gemmatimonadota bacterium]
MHESIVRLFTDHFGVAPVSVREIGADGSNRTYLRLVGPADERAVGGVGPDREENRAFFSFTRTLSGAGFPVPELYAVDEPEGVWLEEDLGDVTLFDALEAARDREPGGFPASMVPVYRRVLSLLPRLQVEGGRRIDFSVAYPRSAFDAQSIRWDLNYFKYHFLKLAHIPFNEQRLEDDFDALTGFLLEADGSHFLYRDFQSRNIMLREGEPWLIDYQGGRRGAVHYDVASLLYDAKAALPEPLRDELLEHYLDALEAELAVDRAAFRERYRGYVVIRMLQAMGAYGYRGFHEGKPRFLQSVPHAARNLEVLQERGLPLSVPELETVFGRIVDRWADWTPGDAAGLTVRITSFSYRGGYPREPDPHGGGFVFDCRALPNPGREPEYVELSGLDEPVIAYLDERDEARSFWEGVRRLADAQVDEYLRRGFTSLTVSFGCTGGQHRSVYMAERLAEHVREAFPQVTVRVTHR